MIGSIHAVGVALVMLGGIVGVACLTGFLASDTRGCRAFYGGMLAGCAAAIVAGAALAGYTP